eukprot:193950-Prorocentrum_minimum.AAC.1
MTHSTPMLQITRIPRDVYDSELTRLLFWAWRNRCAVAESWQLSARKPVYFVFGLIIAVVIAESQTYRWAGGWTFEGIVKDNKEVDTRPKGVQLLERLSARAFNLEQFIPATDERVRFMGRGMRDTTRGWVQFDNVGVVFGIQFRRSALLGLSYHEVCLLYRGSTRPSSPC